MSELRGKELTKFEENIEDNHGHFSILFLRYKLVAPLLSHLTTKNKLGILIATDSSGITESKS